MVISFVKAILCEDNRIENGGCKECLLCKRIDDGNYPELKILVPDGSFRWPLILPGEPASRIPS